MSIWLTSVLPVASALLGVLIANRASSTREAKGRLWDRRADTYIAIFDWATSVENEVTAEHGEVKEIPAKDFEQLAMPDDLLTRMWIFASDPVRYAQGPCRNAVFLLSKDVRAEPIPDDSKYISTYELTCNLVEYLGDLKQVIRTELREGKLNIPATFRIRKLVFRLTRRLRTMRRRHQIRKRERRNE